MIDIKKVHRLTGIYADATTRKLNTGQGTQLSPAVHHLATSHACMFPIEKFGFFRTIDLKCT